MKSLLAVSGMAEMNPAASAFVQGNHTLTEPLAKFNK